jgi:hypothetical protein
MLVHAKEHAGMASTLPKMAMRIRAMHLCIVVPTSYLVQNASGFTQSTLKNMAA